jgi:AcrR family transcriptional regulator
MSMSLTKQLNREEIKFKKELTILKSALYEFSNRGYNSTTMQSIADKALVSKGSLYNYFTNKEDLLKGVLKYGLNQISVLYDQYNGKIFSKKEFEKVIYANFAMIRSDKSFWKLYYNLIAQPKVQLLFNEIFLPFFELYMEMFKKYFKHQGDVDPDSTALLLGSSIDGISLGYIMMEDAYPLDAVIQRLVQKFR